MKLIDIIFGLGDSPLHENVKGITKFTPEYLEKIKEKYRGQLLKDFENGEDRDTYVYAVKNGSDFYRDFTKDMIRSKTRVGTKYTPEYLEKIKEKYKGKLLKDFERGEDRGLYAYVKRQGFDFYQDFTKDMVREKHRQYTDNDLRDIAKKYDGKPLVDFKKNEKGAYDTILRRGREFYDDTTKDMVRFEGPNYTKEKLRDIAKKFTTKSEFIKMGKGAVKAAINLGPFITNPNTGKVKNTYGFYNSITSHMEDKKNASRRLVYVHEFYDEDGKPSAAYVGLTFDAEIRKKEHLQGITRGGKEGLSPVTKYMLKHPSYKHVYKELTNYIDANDASKIEKSWERKYFEDGWDILNVAPTGGLGGVYRLSDKKLKDKVDYIHNVLGVKTLSDFRKNYKNLYVLIIRRGLHKVENGDLLNKFTKIGKKKMKFEHIIIEMIQQDVDELATKEKELVGKGAFHNVYPSNKNPNIVYKIGFDEDVNGWVDLFKSRPDIFPKVYDTGHVNIKLKKQVTNFSWRTGEFKPVTYNPGDTIKVKYVAVERLNTEKAKQYWNSLANVVSTMSGKSLQTYLTSLGMDEEMEEEFLSIGEKIKETGNEFIYKIFVELYNLIHSVYELKPTADVHVGNYGYDKNGNLKCLDI